MADTPWLPGFRSRNSAFQASQLDIKNPTVQIGNRTLHVSNYCSSAAPTIKGSAQQSAGCHPPALAVCSTGLISHSGGHMAQEETKTPIFSPRQWLTACESPCSSLLQPLSVTMLPAIQKRQANIRKDLQKIKPVTRARIFQWRLSGTTLLKSRPKILWILLSCCDHINLNVT